MSENATSKDLSLKLSKAYDKFSDNLVKKIKKASDNGKDEKAIEIINQIFLDENKFIVGTRTSKLALFQTNKVILELKKNFKNFHFEIKEIKTKGDVLLNQTLDRNLDKGFFVNEIQKLLIEQKIDIAVHSLKDLPVENDDGLKISAILKRGNPQDVFLSKKAKKN